MEIGLMIPHTGSAASPEHVREFSVLADELGFDSLWAVDHVVMPHHTDSLYPLGKAPAPVADGAVSALLSPNFELMTTLTWVAGMTERIGLGTSVAVLPIRNALLNARQLSTLDLYSGGRLAYGIGAGWLREEADAMGMPWDRRGRRMEEHIALLRTLWCATDPVEFHGEFHDFALIDPEPLPAQRPIPILIGGHSDAALDRAARIGDGWIAAPMPADALASRVTTLHEAIERYGRDPSTHRIVAAMRPPPPDVPLVDVAAAYAAAGVHHLQLDLAPIPVAARADHLRELAADLLPQVRTL